MPRPSRPTPSNAHTLSAGTRCAKTAAAAGRTAHAPGPDDDSGFLLSRQQLGALAGDAGVRAALGDARLQALLSRVDGAADREAALEAALRGDEFRGFADTLLALLAPSGG
jgi:hypothetical protein